MANLISIKAFFNSKKFKFFFSSTSAEKMSKMTDFGNMLDPETNLLNTSFEILGSEW